MHQRLIAAFVAVYVTWGSTYLAIRFAVETLPPLLMLGTQFVVAGAALLLWARWRAGERPAAHEWLTGAVSGTLMLACGNGSVVLAEVRLSSSVTALLVAIVPLWTVLIDWLRPGGRRPEYAVFLGLALGFGGLLLLVGRPAPIGTAAYHTPSVVLVLAGSFCWALGSIATQRMPQPPSGIVRSATQMLAGGLWSILLGAVSGELGAARVGHASIQSLAALGYLIVFGALVGYSAYLYILAHTSAAMAATYAYVNPVVAVVLGWGLAGEPLTTQTLIAGTVILAGVVTLSVAHDLKAFGRLLAWRPRRGR